MHTSAWLIPLALVTACGASSSRDAEAPPPAEPGALATHAGPSEAPDESRPATEAEREHREEPCPAMACIYTPCPPGVEPPTGCAATCGCTGMVNPTAPAVAPAQQR